MIDSVSESAGADPALNKARRRKLAEAELNRADRLPPHAAEAEQGIIGCILLSPNKSLEQCIDKMPHGPEVFYDLRHRTLYSELMGMYEAMEPIDLITLQQRLKDKQCLEEIGGIPHLNAIQDSVPSAANLSYYIEIVIEKHTLRKLIKTCTDVIGRVYQHSGELDSLLDSVERDLGRISDGKKEIVTALDGKGSSERMINDLERRFNLQGKLPGLDTGFTDLNWMTDGLQFGEQTIIGARPSQGKTALGINIFCHTAITNKIPALFISLEMSVEAVMRRMLSYVMHIPAREIRKGTYTEEQFSKFTQFQVLCGKSPMHIIDGVDGMSIREITAKVRRYVLQKGIKLCVVDYLQKIRPSQRHEKRTYEVGEVSTQLKAIAHENNIAMLTMAQLNRENVKQAGKQQSRPPRLSDLADSGQIERDADLVGLIHRADSEASLIIAKQRDGETGAIRLYFDGTYCAFRNYEHDHDE